MKKIFILITTILFNLSFQINAEDLSPKLDASRIIKGPVMVKISIVEYSDFQCPYCSRGYQTINEVMKKFDGKVNLIFKHMPLAFHPYADMAAKAFEAARIQGKGLEFHNELFDNQQRTFR